MCSGGGGWCVLGEGGVQGVSTGGVVVWHTSPFEIRSASGGTHPTGMLSCFIKCFVQGIYYSS